MTCSTTAITTISREEYKMKMEEKNDTAFPLLKLPSDIWSKICGMTVTYEFAIVLSSDCKEKRKQPPITRVCRIIREECLPYYYKTNVFYARFNPSLNKPLAPTIAAWLNAIGAENRKALRRVLYQPHPATMENWPAITKIGWITWTRNGDLDDYKALWGCSGGAMLRAWTVPRVYRLIVTNIVRP